MSFALWESIGGLRTISHFLMWLAIGGGVVSAAATGLRFYVDRRAGELSANLNLAREAGLKREIDDAQAKLRGRHLTADQAKIIAKESRNRCTALGNVPVTAANSNLEAQVFGTEIVSALRSAGCSADLSLPIPGLRPEITGIHIGVKDLKRIPPGAVELAQVLNAAGIAYDTAVTDPYFFQSSPFVLVVGARE